MTAQEDFDDGIILTIYAKRLGMLSDADIKKNVEATADMIRDAVNKGLI
jgi:hypothetical protein